MKAKYGRFVYIFWNTVRLYLKANFMLLSGVFKFIILI